MNSSSTLPSRGSGPKLILVVAAARAITDRLEIDSGRSELEVELLQSQRVEGRSVLEAQLHQAQRLETVGRLAGGCLI